MQYARKLGASALVIAAAFAVAFAVLISSATTVQADIVTPDPNNEGSFTGAERVANASNGSTVYVNQATTNAGTVLFEITTSQSASASFSHSTAADDGQSIYCSPAATEGTPTCDVDATTADRGVTVAVKIDNDSGKGSVFVKRTLVAEGTSATDEIKITVAQVPTGLSVKAASTSIDAEGGEPGTTTVDIRLTDENGAGIGDKRLTIVSTRALLSGAGGTTGQSDEPQIGKLDGVVLEPFSSPTTGVLAGHVNTSEDVTTTTSDNEAGYARVTVTGGGSPGISTITVTVGELTATEDIVLHGEVDEITAEAAQSAIEVGGATLITVTAVDSAGNPVANQNVRVKARGGVTPPEKLATPVVAVNTVNKDVAPVGGDAAGTGDIPACGDGSRPGDAGADPVVPAAWGGDAGTNDKGQCVIEVMAPNPGGTADDAARGTHTIVIVASDAALGDAVDDVDEVTIEIQVGGAPAAIESDAPERIDPSTELTINLTVLDDEGVRVGGVTIESIQTAGDGAIITAIGARTSDGRAKFTYLAPSTPGVVEFLVRTRDKPAMEAGSKVTSQLPIIIQIAEAMVEPEPEDEAAMPDDEAAMPDDEDAMPDEPDVMVDPTLTPAPAGSVTLTSFSGGSVEELAAALSECGSGVAAHVTVSGVGWVSYVPGAAIAAANAPFNAQFADGIPAPTIFQVTNCN